MPDDVTDRARREAAQWYAELQDDAADAALWQRFLAWERRPEHAAAFREIEQALSVVDRASFAVRARRPERRWLLLSGLAATLVLAAVAAIALLGPGPAKPAAPLVQTYTTGIGAQKSITLEDGSLARLNTDSRIEVSYSATQRRVELRAGQALFDVRKEARPFIVSAGGTETRAIGTEFEVYLQPDGVQVTLIEGLVSVGGEAGSAVILSPGEQMRLRAGEVTVDRIDPARAVAWKSGMIPLTDVTLEAAAAELNRYAELKLRIDPSITGERISGSFKAGDQEGFAAVLEAFLPVEAALRDGEIWIAPIRQGQARPD